METKEIDLQHADSKGNNNQDKDHPNHGPNVKVMIDSIEALVHRGSYTVAEFKAVAGVDPAKELDQIIKGQLTPLDDTAKIVIKGGEEFISHTRAGGSS